MRARHAGVRTLSWWRPRWPRPCPCGHPRRRSTFGRRLSWVQLLNGELLAAAGAPRGAGVGVGGVTAAAATAAAAVRETACLSPPGCSWVDDIFAGRGSETPFSIDWAGSADATVVPAAAAAGDAGDAAAAADGASAELAEAPMVEVETVFDCLAGRAAFLRVWWLLVALAHPARAFTLAYLARAVSERVAREAAGRRPAVRPACGRHVALPRRVPRSR